MTWHPRALLPLTLLMALGMGAACSNTSPPCLQLALPAYFDPNDTASWTRLVASGSAVTLTVINPNSGPGTVADTLFNRRIAQLRSGGLRLLGYVHTNYGRRPAGQVLADIAAYRDWYGISDVFFDEAASDPSHLPLYRGYAQQVRRSGGLVALNPGTVPDRGYGELADVLLTFEGSAEQYRSIPAEPAWLTALPRAKVWHLVHSTRPQDTGAVLALARKRGAGRIYITVRPLPQPWDGLPESWNDQVAAARVSGKTCLRG